MNTGKDHINYSAADIQNYLLGKMSADEMHALEKAALNDPLLAEAMEGYENAPGQTGTPDFTEINKHLQALKSKFSEIDTPPAKTMHTNWWRIAAAVLVVSGGIVFAMYQLSDFGIKKSTPIAQNTPEKEAIPDLKPSDTGLTVNAQKQTVVTETETSNGQKKQPENVITPSIHSGNPAEKATAPPPLILPGNTITPVSISDKEKIEKDLIRTEQLAKKEKKDIEQKQAGNIQPLSVFSGKITGENNQSIPYAKITINNNQFSKTDAYGNFHLSNPDSTIQLDITAANYMPVSVKINAGNDQQISLSSKKTSIKQSKKLSKNDHLSQVLILSKKGIEPKNGWPDFEKFLVNELSNSRYDNGRLVNGETICSFEVDENSEVINFQFEKSIDDDVNEAVKELIKFGPEWKITNTKTNPRVVKLKIIF